MSHISALVTCIFRTLKEKKIVLEECLFITLFHVPSRLSLFSLFSSLRQASLHNNCSYVVWWIMYLSVSFELSVHVSHSLSLTLLFTYPVHFQNIEDHVAFVITVPTALAIFLAVFVLVCIESIFKKLLRVFSLVIWGCLVAMGYLFMFSGGIICPWDQVGRTCILCWIYCTGTWDMVCDRFVLFLFDLGKKTNTMNDNLYKVQQVVILKDNRLKMLYVSRLNFWRKARNTGQTNIAEGVHSLSPSSLLWTGGKKRITG